MSALIGRINCRGEWNTCEFRLFLPNKQAKSTTGPMVAAQIKRNKAPQTPGWWQRCAWAASAVWSTGSHGHARGCCRQEVTSEPEEEAEQPAQHQRLHQHPRLYIRNAAQHHIIRCISSAPFISDSENPAVLQTWWTSTLYFVDSRKNRISYVHSRSFLLNLMFLVIHKCLESLFSIFLRQ